MDSLDDNSCWDLIDYTTLIDDVASTDFDWINQRQVCFDPGKILACGSLTTGTTVWLAIRAVPDFDYSLTSGAMSLGKECAEKECSRKRGRNESCSRIGTKACRERQRRERLNDRFLELSSTLEPGRPVTTDKSAILGDAIRVLNQLRTESQEYKEMNERLQEEIRSLKAEKNELRKEKLALKADKTRMEQQLKTTRVSPAGFMPAHPAAAYQAGPNNMPVFPSYSFVPMWHYLPPSVRDTSHDHELRPPAA